MRSPALIAIVIAAGVLTAWLYFTRAPQVPVTARAASTTIPAATKQGAAAPDDTASTPDVADAAPSASPPPAATVVAVPDAAKVPTPELPATTTMTAQETARATPTNTAAASTPAAPSAAATADENAAVPAADSAAATSTNAQDATASDASASDAAETTPADASTADAASDDAPPADAATDDAAADGNAATSDAPADDATPDNVGTSPIDSNRAADLLADLLAREESSSGEGGENSPGVQGLRTFDSETSDANWSAQATQQIEATLHQALDALSNDMREHIDLIHVECRQTECQILAAETIVTAADGHPLSGQQWPQILRSLRQQAWWNELNFTAMTGEDSYVVTGYWLYHWYLRRTVAAAE